VSASKRAAKLREIVAPGIATCWLGDAPIFAFGDGTLLINGKTSTPHDGALVALARTIDSQRILSAGEDGRILSIGPDGQCQPIFEQENAWYEMLLPHPNGKTCAVIIGREVVLFDLFASNQVLARFKPDRSPNAMAFDGDGKLLAISHSAGVALYETASPDQPLYELPCAGGPISVALDPTGTFLFAGLAEPALAGWRLKDGQGFRMGGYPGKPKQLSFHDNGKAMLTSGGPALLVWPLVGKDLQTLVGPMGQAAGVYRPRLGLATAIASHGDKAVIGWSDGGVDFVNLATSQSRHIGGPRPQTNLDFDPRALTTAIVSVAFRGDGKQVSWIGEHGAYGSAAVQ
jgi:hypothetical protein